MKSQLALIVIPLLAVGCGGGGGGGSGSGSADALFAGPLMYVGAQMRIYGDFNLQLADFNDDGFPELLYESIDPQSTFLHTTIMPGSESELFETEQTPNVGFNTVVDDFDGDGNLDIVSIFDSDNRRRGHLGEDLSFARGNGDNTFADPVLVDLDLSDFVEDIVIGDINGDDIADLLLLDSSGVTPMIGQGDGDFLAAPGVPVEGFVGAIASADLNNDTFDDLVCFRSGSGGEGMVETALSLGDGIFGALQTDVAANVQPVRDLYDFNNDGIPDVLGHSDPNIIVSLGTGDGTFPQSVTTEIPGNIFTRVVADFDGDGNLDLVFVSDNVVRGNAVDSLYIALGLGDGTFESTPTLIGDSEFGPGVDFRDAITMDVDRDGNLDLLVSADYGDLYLRPYFGNGDGTFRVEAPEQIEVLPSASMLSQTEVLSERSTRPLDVDADGNPDLVVWNTTADDLGVFFGNGDLTFEPEQRFPLNQLWPRLSADLDVDGDVDFFGSFTTMDHWYNALRNYGGRNLSILPGMFTTSVTAQLQQVADFDQDGLPDLAFDFFNGDLGVMYNLGDMQFEPMAITPNPDGGFRLLVADVTGDGYPDIVGSTRLGNQAARIHVVPGGPGRTFAAKVNTDFTTPGSFSDFGLTMADFNGDERDDAVWVTNMGGENLGLVKIFRAESNGTLTDTQELFIEGSIPQAPKAVDLDDDQDLDLVVTSFDLRDISIPLEPMMLRIHSFLNDGSSQFQYADGLHVATHRIILGSSTWEMADVNADEYPDAIVYSDRSGLALALANGDGTFRRPNYFRIGGGMEVSSVDHKRPVIGDFDNDGDADFAVIWGAGGSIEFIENRMFR